MKMPEKQEDAEYYSHKNAPIYDLFIIIGLIFNGFMIIFFLLYWLDYI